MNSIIDERFFGHWMSEEDYGDIRIAIAANANDKVQIEVIDLSDGEELVVSNLNVKENNLSFECLTPSTGHRTKNLLLLLDDGSIEHHLTLIERWVRKDRDAEEKEKGSKGVSR